MQPRKASYTEFYSVSTSRGISHQYVLPLFSWSIIYLWWTLYVGRTTRSASWIPCVFIAIPGKLWKMAHTLRWLRTVLTSVFRAISARIKGISLLQVPPDYGKAVENFRNRRLSIVSSSLCVRNRTWILLFLWGKHILIGTSLSNQDHS